MKSLLKKILNKFGYTIVRFKENGIKYLDKSKDKNLAFYETGIGNFYLPLNNNDDIVANAIKHGIIFESEIVSTVYDYVKDGSIVLDIGANYGQMSILFSKKFPGCTVHSFEAQAFVFNIFEKNIKANNCINIIPYYKAVYVNSETNLIFSTPDFSKYGSYGSVGINMKTKEGIVVQSIAIDSIDFIAPISFMKIDIQGSDLFALRGAVNTIQKHRMPIIFEYEQNLQLEFGTSFQDYVNFFREINYRFESQILNNNFLMLPNL